MTIMARVHNRTITLPLEITIPAGAEVSVTLPDTATATSPAKDSLPWLRRARGTATSGLKTGDIMEMTRGEN